MTTATARQASLRRQYVKLCDVRDFDDPLVRGRIREIEPGREARQEVHRKSWEYALLTLFMEDVGALDETTEALSVAAGHETVLFWLSNRIGRVVATDIYGQGSFAEGEADATMLRDASALAPYPYREDRLEVRDMNALELEFPDETFDFVFSLNSIEHFGGRSQITRAAQEMARVLRPGGHAFIVTECFVRRHPLNVPALQALVRVVSGQRLFAGATPRRRVVEVLTPAQALSWIVRGSGLELLQPLDREVSTESWENLAHVSGADGLTFRTGERWPHVLLEAYGSPWTSLALALRKPE